MANRIKRASIFIEMTACTNSAAFKSGESVGVKKMSLVAGSQWTQVVKIGEIFLKI